MNVLDFVNKKNSGDKISMITCYDSSFAKIINQTQIDCVLVGDSLAMTILGHKTTLNATVDIMALFVEAVVRGAPDKFVIGDMPFMSYRGSLSENMKAVDKIMKAGCQAIKLEGAAGNIELIKHIVESGVPVMGHLGLTPQSVNQFGGYRVQGREEKSAQRILEDARMLEESGCFSIVLECVPTELAKKITEALHIPTIGIGAGSYTDGQVLVLQDMLGMNQEFSPKFVKKFMNGFESIKGAVDQYHNEVVQKKFPSEKESYS